MNEHANEYGHIVNGVVIGVVSSVDDPENEGRVEVRFPWMEGNNQSYWAPPATLMSGSRRGSWFMPEEGDEVLVCFDHGRVDHPYIVGYLWNGEQLPPNEGIDPQVRRLQTVSGHRIDFDDRSGSEKVLVHSSSGHEVQLDDAEHLIRIRTSAGMQIEIDDQGRMKVDAAVSVDVNTLKATFSGVVEAKMVKAQLGTFEVVKGSAYVPGPGDTYGL